MAECATCKHWGTNDDSKYIDRCNLHNFNITFNHSCSDHTPITLTVKAGEQLDEKVRDYNGMRLVVNGVTLKPTAPITANGLTVKDWIS